MFAIAFGKCRPHRTNRQTDGRFCHPACFLFSRAPKWNLLHFVPYWDSTSMYSQTSDPRLITRCRDCRLRLLSRLASNPAAGGGNVVFHVGMQCHWSTDNWGYCTGMDGFDLRAAVFVSTRWDEMKLYVACTCRDVPREEAANHSPKQKPSRFCRWAAGKGKLDSQN